MDKRYAEYTIEDFVKKVRECFAGLEKDDPDRVEKFFAENGDGFGICQFHYDEYKETLQDAIDKWGATPDSWMQGRIDDAFDECNLEI